ncbi:hypothetical protein CJD36_020195 [Flavipsychrobacter stenotrophus]|uniref:Fibrobacter succinogenes major paralogous domain-containing protein n=1 Tax=Flavipsychrobacter stenotrophus TaxID=2077091 RepID=A0A2S7SR64_9BACT|nr:fibrobacter succinogenes major paralogous domain-containing protein [Flavipsychrobacter stenotrophus]PQJ09121.1 hypothetical protein CJD36_020195 [Flavipsychrobacter stenotrophus]
MTIIDAKRNNATFFLIILFCNFCIGAQVQHVNSPKRNEATTAKKGVTIEKIKKAEPTKKADGVLYKSVKIGNQIWMAENLNVTRFRNGDSINEAKSDNDWNGKLVDSNFEMKSAWANLNLESENIEQLGCIYSGGAVIDPRGLAPKGWHIPTEDEWLELIEYLGGENIAGKKLKDTTGWEDDGNGTNVSGFSALPASYLLGGMRTKGQCFFWTSNVDRKIMTTKVYRMTPILNSITYIKLYSSYKSGYSVRCIKD